MKKNPIMLFIFLAFALTACNAVPVAPPTAPPPVVVTVIVPVEVTQPAPPPLATAIPTEPPLPTSTQVQEEPTVEPTEMPPTVAPQSNVGGLVFTDITRLSDTLSLNCLPTEITFNVTAIDPYIVETNLYIRMQEYPSGSVTGWKNAAVMKRDGNNYSYVLKAVDINPDWRYEKGWLDYQFVAVNKYHDVIGRSEKITKEIVFTRNCS
ncbi:MAG: hypothetical protein HQ525_03885 [Anaerolineae bacterium]|nr:hypothetical protein [Anaerolineae bacterium]